MFVDSRDRPLRWLATIALVQAAVYLLLAWLSSAFAYGTVQQQRPILAILTLLAGSFLLYVLAIRVALRCPASRRLTWTIVGSALVFRLLLVPSHPIQEIDIYRYLWDGAATAHGVSPYRFAPDQILAAEAGRVDHEELQRLVQLRDASPALGEILGRIHFSYLPTIYPPVSQAVFVATYAVTPCDSSVRARVAIQKAVLVLLDMGTVGLVWLLLRRAGMHPGLLVAYAWCPLVMKEFANSGHHDAIAVFLSVAAIACVTTHVTAGNPQRLSPTFFGAALLGLAVGAKLYPIVLLPLLAAWVTRRGGFVAGGRFMAIALTAVALCMAPMLWAQPAWPPSSPDGAPALAQDLEGVGSLLRLENNAVELSDQSQKTPDPDGISKATDAAVEPTAGLHAFLTQWEMNDFLFLITFENLRPVARDPDTAGVWFAVIPDPWRRACVEPVAAWLGIGTTPAAFLVARAVTAGVFVAIAVGLLWKFWQDARATTLLECGFLTLAWFWLLSPTQNPWYWAWALPLLPFARGRAWIMLSGLVFLYYLRFWLQYHYPNTVVLGTPYTGTDFFDLLVTWVEYAPWFGWLLISTLLHRERAPAEKVKESSSSVGRFTEQKASSA